jgi:Cdc6-like AAA superfamily ATPase
VQLVLSMSGSTKYKINDTKSIANFKQTQREAAHSYDLLSETQKLVGKEFTLDDFEKQVRHQKKLLCVNQSLHASASRFGSTKLCAASTFLLLKAIWCLAFLP